MGRRESQLIMGDEISLSIEETNKLRIQLGLKPIPSYGSETNNELSQKISFINEDKIFSLRNRLSKINQRINRNKPNDNKDWLNQVGKGGQIRQDKVKVQQYSEDEENNDTFDTKNEDLPIMQISHDINNLSKGCDNKTIFLTLKDRDIINGDDTDGEDVDILENEDLTIEEETEKNLKLKKMNKIRRRNKMTLQVSSMDINTLENDKEPFSKHTIKNTVIVGGIIQSDKNRELMASKSQTLEDEKGKIRVIFNSDNEEEDEMTDFKRVKIKRRKRKNNEQSSNRKRKKIEIPQYMSFVQLNEEEKENGDELNELNETINIIPQRQDHIETNKPNKDENEIMKTIKRGQRERQERIKSINRIEKIHRQGLTIDENSTFFDLLNTNIVTNHNLNRNETRDINKNLEDNNIEEKLDKSSTINEPLISERKESKPKVDFYDGIASTLNFLKDQNMLALPKREPDTSVNSTRNELPNIDNKSNGNKQSNDNIDLNNYNPVIKLEYKDAQGNLLTTKEAYKKLSQKFHGTKSNRKKQMKFNQRVIERNQYTQSR